MYDRFYGKTWLYWVQLMVSGGMGLFALPLGILFWTEAMPDASGQVRPEAGPPMVIIGGLLLIVAAMAAVGIKGRVAPLIRCWREGIECTLVGASSLDGARVPRVVWLAWAIGTLQGFRTQRLRIAWSEFGGAHVEGAPMAYVLILRGKVTNLKSGRLTEWIGFRQFALKNSPQEVAAVLNSLAADNVRRAGLATWESP